MSIFDPNKLFVVRWRETDPRDGDDRDAVIVNARDREDAKRYAQPHLSGDPDEYTVEPLPVPSTTPSGLIWRL